MLDDPVSAVLAGTGMLVRCASTPLRAHLGCFWALAGEGVTTIETLPDGGGQVVVELSEGTAASVFISVPRSGPGRYNKPAGTKVIGVRLRPGVGYLLLRRPMYALVDRRLRIRARELAHGMVALHTWLV